MQWTHLPSSALRLTGDDRVDFTHGQMTGDLRRAPTPGMVSACFLNVRGQIEFFARAYRRSRDVYLHLGEGQAPALAQRLQKYVIFDQVSIEDVTDRLRTVHLWTPDLPGWQADGPDVQEIDVAGHTVLAARVNRTGTPGLDVHVLSAALSDVLTALGGTEVPMTDLEGARVNSGIPDVTRDGWQGSLPQEVGLEGAVSYRKGCYVGQEIMARLEARGNTRNRLAAVEADGELPSHADVTHGGKVVGRTGHAVGGRALVKLRKEVAAGTTVEVEGAQATVADVQQTA